MSIKDFICSKLGKQPKTTPMQIMHEKVDRTKYINTLKDNAEAIRLIYVAIEEFTRYGTPSQKLLGSTFIKSSPFKLPEGMSIEEACRVISFITKQVEDKFFEATGSKTVALTSKKLEDYGFEKIEDVEKGYTHVTYDNYSKDKLNLCEPKKNVLDLITVGGEWNKFKNTNLYDRYFNWFTEGVRYDEIREIYERLDIAVTDLIELDPNEQLTIEEM